MKGRALAWPAALRSPAGRTARAAEEHSGPHMPWFWQGVQQGGGVLNDMMCHSVEVVRFLLSDPQKPRGSIRPTKITAHIHSLKWSRPEYVQMLKDTMGPEVDYAKRPSEDFARATIEYVDEAGRPLIGEVTTSWSFVGAGLRLSMELLGPEYSFSHNSPTPARTSFSAGVTSRTGEDPWRSKRRAGPYANRRPRDLELRLRAGNCHFVRCFLEAGSRAEFSRRPRVVELLMTAYMSAERGRTSRGSHRMDTFVRGAGAEP